MEKLQNSWGESGLWKSGDDGKDDVISFVLYGTFLLPVLFEYKYEM